MGRLLTLLVMITLTPIFAHAQSDAGIVEKATAIADKVLVDRLHFAFNRDVSSKCKYKGNEVITLKNGKIDKMSAIAQEAKAIEKEGNGSKSTGVIAVRMYCWQRFVEITFCGFRPLPIPPEHQQISTYYTPTVTMEYEFEGNRFIKVGKPVSSDICGPSLERFIQELLDERLFNEAGG